MNMMNRLGLKVFLAVAALLAVLGVSFAPAYAQCNPTDTKSAIQCGTDNSAGVPVGAKTAGQSLNDTIATIVKLASLAVGILATFMIIAGGFRYMTSGGKEESVKGAKNMILYAIIGLVIVALAQIIVHFVLYRITTSTP
jgi:hypothetical protein